MPGEHTRAEAEGGTGKMKIAKQLMKGFLSVMALTALLAQPALASNVEPSDEQPYTYTVTLSAGNQGAFNGTDTVEVTGIAPGTVSVSFSAYRDQLQISDEKYYAKGIRLSGRDNSDASYSPDWASGQVMEDADYVVAYGMRGDMVAYTVQYLDEEGNALMPANTYYGSIGDRPVVAFQYIEGYLPQAYNLTKTLTANEAENVFPFVYTPATETVTVVETEPAQDDENVTITVPGEGTTGTGTTGGGAAGTGAGADDQEAAGGEGEAADDQEGAGGEAGAGDDQEAAGGEGEAADDQEAAGGEAGQEADEPVEIPADSVPQGTIDLDEEDVPLGNLEDDDEIRETSVLPVVLGVSGGVVALGVIIGGVIYLKQRMK